MGLVGGIYVRVYNSRPDTVLENPSQVVRDLLAYVGSELHSWSARSPLPQHSGHGEEAPAAAGGGSEESSPGDYSDALDGKQAEGALAKSVADAERQQQTRGQLRGRG